MDYINENDGINTKETEALFGAYKDEAKNIQSFTEDIKKIKKAKKEIKDCLPSKPSLFSKIIEKVNSKKIGKVLKEVDVCKVLEDDRR